MPATLTRIDRPQDAQRVAEALERTFQTIARDIDQATQVRDVYPVWVHLRHLEGQIQALTNRAAEKLNTLTGDE